MPQKKKHLQGSALPLAVRERGSEIAALTDRFCAKHLDAEYGQLCRKLIDKLARKRPSPLTRGEPRTWAGGVLYVVGMVNFLFDPSQRPHLTSNQLSELASVGKSTLSAKSRTIRELLRMSPLDTEFCRREILAKNPLVWLLEVDGLLVDSRTMPPELQEEARRKGLLPEF